MIKISAGHRNMLCGEGFHKNIFQEGVLVFGNFVLDALIHTKEL